MMKSRKNKGLSSAELSTFCGQVALILEAGIPLYDGMETLAGVDSAGAETDLYSLVSRKVTATGSLYEALKDDDRWPEYLVEMTGIGEKSGRLEQVMKGMESYYAREARIRSAVRSAITYPVVLGVLLIVIVLILLWKVLPVFRRVMNSMGITMDQSGGTLMRIGTVIGWIAMILVALFLLAAVIFLILMKTRYKDRAEDLLKRWFPAFRKLKKQLSASRAAGVLSMVLSGGFPAAEALEMTSRVLNDADAAEKIGRIRTALDNGSTFAQALSGSDLFDDLQNRMILMGSATGREDQVLEKIARQSEEQAEEGISRLVSIIEPTLVALLAVIIGAVLLSVMMSMAGILTGM